jgi:hypothetical protein
LLMWKPVRLQGIGDGAVTINANAHPAGKQLEPWRRQVNCLFGLALNGGVLVSTGFGTNNYDPTGQFTCAGQAEPAAAVDALVGEPILGWDATLNGNLAELLQEPTLMGAYEGAGITVLARGLENPNTANCTPLNALGCIPLNNLTGSAPNNGFNGGLGDCNPSSKFYYSNYLCNPARVDGITFTNSSQGGGGIFLHGWDHYTEVSNNHVFGNGGTLSGGIVVGQPENVDPTLVGASNNSIAQPLLLDHDVNVHNNSVTFNAAYGDELNSATPASSGGVTFCTGSDYYKFQYNWVCGNLSTGNGGGFAHYGFIWNGDIEHNWFIFNQSINPTLTTHGGGAIVAGQAPDGAACEGSATVDFDCPPALSDGAGPGLVINGNLFQGNTAEEGSGGGLRLQFINGNDVLNNPNNPAMWYRASVTNNIFANNVAGWVGGGVSLIDSALVDFINNTVVSNDSTASAGVLFDSVGAPMADVPPQGCNAATNPNCTGFQITTSTKQPAGLATEKHTINFLNAFTTPGVTCPVGHSQCTQYSNPMINNDLFFQNRAFNITVTPPSGGVVALSPSLNQTATGQCPGGASYWDIGVYGDSGPGNHAALTLSPSYSILTDASDYPGANNLGSNPAVVSQYCNGSRVPPEIAPTLCSGVNGNANAQGCTPPGAVGITVPPGVADSVTPPQPLFTLSPSATVDEGSNWINMFYGPLSLTNAVSGSNVPIGNYSIQATSPAVGFIPSSVNHPTTDFFGNQRPDPSDTTHFDIGAVEFGSVPAPTAAAVVSFSGPAPALTTTTANRNTKNGVITVTNTGTGPLTLIQAPTISQSAGPGAFSITGGTCTAGKTLAAGNGACTINVQYVPPTAPTALATATASVTVTDTGAYTATQTSPNFNGN